MNNLKSKCRNAKYFATQPESKEDERPLLEDMEQGMSRRNLVSHESGAKFPQYCAALSATIGGFCMGSILGWTSPTEAYLEKGKYGFPVSEIDFSLISALVNLGAMVGALSCGAVADRFGRKKTMIALVIPAVIGYALIIFASSAVMMMVGRTILGIPVGAYSMVCPLYTNEIAEISIRGTLGTLFQLQVTIGILFVYVLGIFCNPFPITIICVVFPVLLSTLMIFMPETPYYYLMKKMEQDAKKSMQWLRGQFYNIDEEIASTKQIIHQVQTEKLGFVEAFSTTPAKRGLVIGVGVMVLQQFSGINAVIFFAGSIFQAAGSTMDTSISSVIVGAMSVIACGVSTIIIDRLGRKPLLFLSALIMAISAAVLGIYFYIQIVSPHTAVKISFIPLISVCVFIIVFSIGLGPIPWMLLAEIFPSAIKGPASSISCLVNWVCVFIVTFAFKPLKNSIGAHWTFWIFALLSGLGAVFVFFLIPETKGKTIEEVQVILGGKPLPRNTSDSRNEKF